MTTRTIANAILAVTLAVPAVAAIAAQPFGRDTVYAAASASGASQPAPVARNDAQPYGRDTVNASRISGSGQSATSTADVAFKPGRA